MCATCAIAVQKVPVRVLLDMVPNLPSANELARDNQFLFEVLQDDSDAALHPGMANAAAVAAAFRRG